MNYKTSNDSIKIELVQNLEDRKIDVSFMKKDFIESYDQLKNIGNDHFTFDDSDIVLSLDELENGEIPILAVNKIGYLFHQSPYQIIRNICPQHLNILLNFLLQNETQYYVLYSLCYIIQTIQDLPDFIQILIDLEFYNHLNEIMSRTREITMINLCLFILIHSFQFDNDVKNIIINSNVLETIESYDFLNIETNVLISRLLETVFSIENWDFIEPIYNSHGDFLLKRAFYGNSDEKNKNDLVYALKGLLNLFQNFPETTLILSQNNGIDILSKNLIDKDEEIRNYSSLILLECIKEIDFPIIKFYEYNTINSILTTFNWNDENLHLSCIESIKNLLDKDDEQIMEQTLAEINNTDFFAQLKPLSFNVKKQMLLLFVGFFIKLDSTQIEFILNAHLLSFLFDFIGQIKYMNTVSLIFNNILDKSESDEMRNQILDDFFNNDILDTLEELVLDEEAAELDNGNTNELIAKIKDIGSLMVDYNDK